MDNYGPPPAYRDVMAQEQRQGKLYTAAVIFYSFFFF